MTALCNPCWKLHVSRKAFAAGEWRTTRGERLAAHVRSAEPAITLVI